MCNSTCSLFPPARFGKVVFKSAYYSASADIEGIELPMPTDGNQVMFSELKVNRLLGCDITPLIIISERKHIFVEDVSLAR
ncbi:hypothetical protein GBAR_LOCUS12449 [Geodia barretti]|uniref:Uncharacterized protein n=1 Tax=Geodia barretti TaxID=519541 RepID=A0AA35S0W4_GEOBA|nr:hypothetical protein GBAR_LOCUS12449 [Geodia barretti]